MPGLPSSLSLSATCQNCVPLLGGHWHPETVSSPLVHTEDPASPSLSTIWWLCPRTFCMHSKPASFVTPWTLSSEAAPLRETLTQAACSASAPISEPSTHCSVDPLTTLFQSPGTSRVMIFPFFQPISPSYPVSAAWLVHFNNCLDSVPDFLVLLSFHPIWPSATLR